MNREFFFINNVNKIGEFYLHYASEYDTIIESTQIPVFKVIHRTDKDILLIPGFKIFNNKFYRCPLISNFVQIDYITFITTNAHKNLKSKLIIFSKDFKQNREIIVELNSKIGFSNSIDLLSINIIVNIINEYILYDNSIFELDEKYFKNRYTYKNLDIYNLSKIIDSLDFKWEYKNIYRFTKDDLTYQEHHITNLPKSHYLKLLLVQIIEESRIVDRVELLNHEIIYTKNYSEDFGLNIPEKVKEFLKFNILPKFNPVIERNEALKKYF